MKYLNNSIQSQRERLLAWLRKCPITTIQARHNLDILGVAPRIYELRHDFGHNIHTHWTYEQNPGGDSHRIAQYVLLPGIYKQEEQHA